jgi:hypothetical protein
MVILISPIIEAVPSHVSQHAGLDYREQERALLQGFDVVRHIAFECEQTALR